MCLYLMLRCVSLIGLQTTEDEMRLLRFQRKLDDEKGAGLLGLSLQVDTRGGAPWPADVSLYQLPPPACSVFSVSITWQYSRLL